MASRASGTFSDTGRGDGVKIGVVAGKFAPLHRGHQHVIERALGEVDEVIVAVYDTPGYAPPVEKRAAWVRVLYPEAQVLVLPDPAPEGDDEAVSHAYARHFLAHHRGPVTHVFSSEDYGERFAQHLGATHMAVDPDRTQVPVSGTAVRSDPHAWREFVEPLVYRDLVHRICLTGAESTGKTTLAAALADRCGTKWMPEYGRELFEERGGNLDFEDFLAIGHEHLRREDELALEADRFLFCDTNVLATIFWCRFYCGRVDPALELLADEVAGNYRYVLCLPDIPWHQDGWRETGGGPLWHEHQAAVRADLERRGLAYVEAGGALDERVEAVVGRLGET